PAGSKARPREGGERPLSRAAPDVINDDLEAGGARLPRERLGKSLLPVIQANARIGAEVVQRTQRPFIASRGDHTPGAKEFGYLHGKLSSHSGRAEDQDRFTCDQLCAVVE